MDEYKQRRGQQKQKVLYFIMYVIYFGITCIDRYTGCSEKKNGTL